MSGSPGVLYGFESGSDAGLAEGLLNLEMETKDLQLGGFTGTVLGGWAFSLLCLEVPGGQGSCHLNCPHLAAPSARPLSLMVQRACALGLLPHGSRCLSWPLLSTVLRCL